MNEEGREFRVEVRARVEEAPVGQLPALLGTLAEATAHAQARLLQEANGRPRSESASRPAPPAPRSRLLTVKEVAERLQVKPSWIYEHRDELGGVKLSSRALRFREDRLEAWLAARPR